LSTGKNVKIENRPFGDVGFSYVRDDTGRFIAQKHEFGLIIEDDVDVGCFTTIDRGSWRDTVIGKGTKIDNHAHISHNCIIGKHCIISAHTTILGSVEVGDYSEIWSNAIIHQRIKIGKNCMVGANSYIRHDVPDEHCAYIYKGIQVNKRLDEVNYPKKVY